MECISAINPIPNQIGKDRMDLHCVKPYKPTIYLKNSTKPFGRMGCGYECHMGIITNDPNPWECHEYNFSFGYNGDSFLLISRDTAVDYRHQGRRKAITKLIRNYEKPIIQFDYFIPISTGDDMHEEATSLFHKLRKLVAFS
jgi:hypothetical protein